MVAEYTVSFVSSHRRLVLAVESVLSFLEWLDKGVENLGACTETRYELNGCEVAMMVILRCPAFKARLMESMALIILGSGIKCVNRGCA